jgi:hypothetical protein
MRDQAEKIIEVTSHSLAVGNLPRPAVRPLVRRPATDNVQDLWRRYGWVPPTEMQKNFRATLRTTANA